MIIRNKSRISQTVCEKTYYKCFSLQTVQVENKAILGKINFYCSLHTGLKIRLNFAIIYSRLRDPLIDRDIHKLKILDLENVGQGNDVGVQHSQ